MAGKSRTFKERRDFFIGAYYFKPNPLALAYVFKRSRVPDTVSDKDICREMNISEVSLLRTKALEGFDKWYESELCRLRQPIWELLEHTAIQNLKQFSFWEAMAKKYGYIESTKAEEDAKLEKVMSEAEVISLVDKIRKAQ
jgi:hypothetical protein